MSVYYYSLQISLRDLANKEVRKIEMNIPIDDLFYAGTGVILLRNEEGLQLFDVQQKRVMAHVKATKVRVSFVEIADGALYFCLRGAVQFLFYNINASRPSDIFGPDTVSPHGRLSINKPSS